MIIFDIQLGRFSILALRQPDWCSFKAFQEGPAEITVDMPYVRVFLTDEKRAANCSQITKV